MAITKNESIYAGSLNTSEGSTPLTDLSYKPEEKKLEAEFDFNGMTIILAGVVNGDTFDGTVSTGDYQFPMKGTRKK
jgi:hypothetical protein